MRQKSGNYCELVLDVDALGKMTMLKSLSPFARELVTKVVISINVAQQPLNPTVDGIVGVDER